MLNLPSRRLSRRAVGLAAASVTALSLALVPSAPASADGSGTKSGADWLSSQLDGGLMPSQSPGFPDYGLSIDTALALVATERRTAVVDRIEDAVSADINNYAAPYTYEDGGDTYGGTPSNATGKAAVFASAVGADPTDFGGLDLIGQLESVIADEGVTRGRLSDQPTRNGEPDPTATDYANTLGQSYAVAALDKVESEEANRATGFLLKQQCEGGWFRLSFSRPTKGDQSCDAAADAKPDTDVTAIAMLQLLETDRTRAVDAAIDDAVAWLKKRQAQNGAFGGAGPTSANNANSTGLASWALHEAGARTLARNAAAWVSGRQLVNVRRCSPYAGVDVGAIAYDNAALEAAADRRINTNADQFRRATAQALPSLQWAPARGPVKPCRG